LDAKGIEPREPVSASRKLGRKDAAALAKSASRVIVAKGKKLEEWETAGKAPAAAIDAMVGSTGNLRAPCLRTGKTVVVGFNEDVYTEVLL